jgi:hypothetical protein
MPPQQKSASADYLDMHGMIMGSKKWGGESARQYSVTIVRAVGELSGSDLPDMLLAIKKAVDAFARIPSDLMDALDATPTSLTSWTLGPALTFNGLVWVPISNPKSIDDDIDRIKAIASGYASKNGLALKFRG